MLSECGRFLLMNDSTKLFHYFLGVLRDEISRAI